MSDDIIARAEAALEGVTDGPWTWDGDTFSDAPEYKCPHGTQWCDHGPDLVRGNDDGSVLDDYVAANYVISSNGYDASGLEVKTADAEFIAASRSLVPELVAELKTTRAQLETLRAGLTRVEHFARIQALSERVRTGPAHSTYHCEERYWLDLLALIERAEVTDV